MPGDRSDALIRECGRVCAPYLDRVVFKEDQDLRGRQPGETARLLGQGFREAQSPAQKAEVVLNEVEAVEYAVELLEEGDLLVVFYEHRKPLVELLRNYAARPVAGGEDFPAAAASGSKARAVPGKRAASKAKAAE